MIETSMGPKVGWLSPSKIATAIEKCPWQLRTSLDLKEQGIPTPSNWPMLGGRALHKGVELALRELKSGKALPGVEGITAWVRSAWAQEIAKAEEKHIPIQDGEDKSDDVLAGMVALVPVVRKEVLEKLHPKRLEEPFKEKIERDGVSFEVWGQIDYEDVSLKILDWKTTKKAKDYANKKDIQMMAYGWWQRRVEKVEVPKIWKIFLEWGGGPQVKISDPFKITPEDCEYFERMAVKVWKMCQADTYSKKTDGWWCDKRWCSFFGPCQGGW